MQPELKTINIKHNDLDSIINTLVDIRADHGNIPTFLSGMEALDECTLHIGATNYMPEDCPKGYLRLGHWV